MTDIDKTVDPNPSHKVDLDFPTLGRLVEAEGQDLFRDAEFVKDEILDLARDQDWEPAANILDIEAEIPRSSPDELIARLNGIGQSAYRLARHIRTLTEFRQIHLVRRALREAGDL